jgi:hypothetical protein
LDRHLVNFIVSGNLPFASVHNENLKQFCDTLAPNVRYKLPSRQTVVSRIEAYAVEVIARKMDNIKLAGPFTLLMDGWSDSSRKSVMGVMASCSSTSHLISAENMSTVRHQAVNLQKHLVDQVSSYLDMADPQQVIAFVTDSPSVMIALRNSLSDAYPNIIGLPCALHVINLMIKDLCNVDPAFLTDIKHLITFYNDGIWKATAEKWAKDQGKPRAVPTYARTRWYSLAKISMSIDHYETWLKSATQLPNMPEIQEHYKDLLNDAYLYPKNKEFLHIVQLFSNAIGNLESSNAHPGEVMVEMLRIRFLLLDVKVSSDFGKSLKVAAIKVLNARWPQFDTPVHWLGLALDPLTKNLAKKVSLSTLEECMIEVGRAWKVTAGEMIEVGSDWKKYWQIPKPDLCLDTITERWESLRLPALKKFALRLLSIVPHAAQVESLFSKLAAIKTKGRNSMDVKHLQQIAHIKEALSKGSRKRKRDSEEVGLGADDGVQLDADDGDALDDLEKPWGDEDDVVHLESRDFMTSNFDAVLVKKYFQDSNGAKRHERRARDAPNVDHVTAERLARMDYRAADIFGR